MDSDDPSQFTVYALSECLGNATISSTQLVGSLLRRIGEHDSKLHAFVEVYADDALAAAHAADKAARGGHRTGPLHGIPVAIKDIVDIGGRITTSGSVAVKRRALASATVVTQLTAAGMIMIGKTHTVEFAMGGWGTNQHMGTPWNPWDMNVPRTPGGSSSGSAVAVAARLVPCAIGSDTGGSLRMPASWCGIVGFKPTIGKVSTRGVTPLSPTLDSVGPLTRSVEDAAMLYAALNVCAANAGGAIDVSRAELTRGVAGLRLAAVDQSECTGIDSDVRAAYDESLEMLRRLDAEVIEVRLPRSFAEFARLVSGIIIPEGYAALSHMLDDPSLPLDEDVRARLLPGRDVSASAYLHALAAKAAIKEEFGEMLAGIDAVLTPTTLTPAIRLVDVDQSAAASHFTRMANYLDLCALAIPNGATSDGLPISLQMICKPNDEALLLRIGWALEQATRWHLRTPSLSPPHARL